MKKLFLAILVSIALVCSSCDSTTEPVDNRELKLSLVSTTLTEISLKLSTVEIELPANITINKNSSFYKQIILKSNDSTFTADSLQPNTSYTFQAVSQLTDGEVASEIVTAKTIGTTSQDLVLTVEDQSSTELWVSLKTGNIILPASLTLALDSNPITQFSLTNRDTLIYIDSLQPGSSYSLEVIYGGVKSEPTAAQTLGTTSHNFTIETFTFGEHSSSALLDVAIIDENNIWAVGAVYMNDSVGQPDPEAFNAVHWDGSEWEIKKISVEFNGFPTIAPLEGIFALGTGEIILTSGVPYLPDGNGNWKLYHLWNMGILDQDDGGVTRIWGTSLNNLFFVGRKGSIVHYDGSNWQKLESGTSVNINDIWGSYNNQTGKSFILCAASNVYQLGENKILSINDQNEVDFISWNTGRRVHSVWFENNFKMHASGSGVFFGSSNSEWKEQTDLPLTFTRRIRGNAKNDLFVTGDFGLVAHFNGVEWNIYNEAAAALFYSLDYVGNTMVAVGQRNGKAVVLVMKRN
jgi:hypothetical protein